MAALTLIEVKNYLRVDFSDDDNLIQALMDTADEYLKASVGLLYDNMSERAKTLSLIVVSDLYDNRGIQDKASNNTRRLVDDFSLQMRLELRV